VPAIRRVKMRKRTPLLVGSLVYFTLALGFWVAWEGVTDRRMHRDSEAVYEQLRVMGVAGEQAAVFIRGIDRAYGNSKSYSSMLVFVLIITGQGLVHSLIFLAPERDAGEGARTPNPAAPERP